MFTVIYFIIAAAFLISLFIVIRNLLKSYFKYRGKMIVTCPENQKPAGVEVDAKHAALTTTIGEGNLTLKDCTRWPERENCGQECLRQIEVSPENCLVRIQLTNWYSSKQCIYCGKNFEDIHWHDHKPALLSLENELMDWSEIPLETLNEVLDTHKPVCWNCYIAETFRRDHPDLVTDRPWNRGHLV